MALLVLLLILLVLLIITFFVLAFYVLSVAPYGGLTPPFVPTSKKLAALIAETLDPSPGSVMYELGAGDMRISLAAWQRQPGATYIGIEKHFFPRMLARFNVWKNKAGENVSVCEANLYRTDLRHATHVYCYLFPDAMQKLHEKFSEELRPGALVVSLDFKIAAKEPERAIDLRPHKLRLGKELYVYRY